MSRPLSEIAAELRAMTHSGFTTRKAHELAAEIMVHVDPDFDPLLNPDVSDDEIDEDPEALEQLTAPTPAVVEGIKASELGRE